MLSPKGVLRHQADSQDSMWAALPPSANPSPKYSWFQNSGVPADSKSREAPLGHEGLLLTFSGLPIMGIPAILQPQPRQP